jgi:hypothetical protein
LRRGSVKICRAAVWAGSVALCFSLLSIPMRAQERAQTPDITIVPKPIIDTMDDLELHGRKRDTPGERKADVRDSCLLSPLSLVRSPLVAASALRVPPEAKNEYIASCVDLKKAKVESAEKHLRKAVKYYPQYSAAWVTLGQVLATQNRTDEARNACEQASAAEPKYIPAYLCLADLATRTKAWADVLQLSDQAIRIDPAASPLAYEYSAAASFRMNKLEDAEKAARQALEMDKKNGVPQLHFLLAQIYEAKSDRANEILQLREFLTSAGNSEEVATVKRILAELEKSPTGPDSRSVQKAESAPNGGGDLLSQPEVAVAVVATEDRAVQGPNAAATHDDLPSKCNLEEVLPQVQSRIREFVDNVQRFTATETLVHESINGAGRVARAEHGKYDYVVSIEEAGPAMLAVNEYLNSRPASTAFHPEVVTKGLPALLLMFHPYYAVDFSMRCEGLTILKGNPAWQIGFRQRDDKPSRIRSYQTGAAGQSYEVKLQGHAWFTADSFQIIKLEADLLNAIPEIQLTVDHTSAEYGPVFFRSRGIEIWLPQTADLVSERRGKRLHERISFSDYLLFSIDNKQELSAPKPQEWLSSERICRMPSQCSLHRLTPSSANGGPN